ncbi:hypothetical protein TWF696_006703 [Orbilia brochopaga]|uniref:Uncharacterized protein n=1 Tax=Orbilia brochopaga TaxID=3140254 RepID=A0AAV9UVW3_9PEZI
MTSIKLVLVAILGLTGATSAAPAQIERQIGRPASEGHLFKRAVCWAGVHLCWDVDLKECIRQFDGKGGQTQTFSEAHTTVCSARDCRVVAYAYQGSATVR